MARLRFPGRPGYRFDRLGVRYGVDEPRRGLDPTTRLIANVHRGLRYFRELFGESDEEDFEGFYLRDVRKAEKKVSGLLDPLSKIMAPRPRMVAPSSAKRVLRSRDTLEVTPVSVSTSSDASSHVSKVTDRKESMSSAQKVKVIAKERVSLRKMHKKLLQKGLVKPMKATLGSKVRQMEIKRQEKEKLKLKKEKEKRLALKKKERSKRQEKEKERREKVIAELEQRPLKLKPIKIRLGSDGSEAKIVRGRGRPSIYDKDTLMCRDESSSEATSPRSRTTKKVRFEDDTAPADKQVRRKKVVVVPSTKRVDKTVAKQLLARAKKGRSQRQRRQEEAEFNDGLCRGERGTGSPGKRRQFVLPAVSSRSSRKIIPNKRFIEETFAPYVTKKVKFGSPPQLPVSPRTSPLLSHGDRRLSAETNTSLLEPPGTPPSSGLPDTLTGSPLIVAGKRERKPSMKLIMKLTDEDVMSRKLENRKKIEEKKKHHCNSPSKYRSDSPGKHHGEMVSPLRPTASNIEQLKAAGFSQAEIQQQIEAEQFELSDLEELERTAEATKRSGQNILRKAKLQLNRAALNRSKAALARSLKREMKKEERKMASLKASEQLSVKTVGFGGFRSQAMSNLQLSPLKLTTFGQQGIGGIPQVPKFSLETSLPTSPLLGAGLSTAASGSPPGETFSFPKDSPADLGTSGAKSRSVKGHAHQPDLPSGVCAVCNQPLVDRYAKGSITYYGVPCCPPCQWFYRRRVWQQVKEGMTYVCSKDGNCDIRVTTRSCIACRFRRCQDVLPSKDLLLFTKKKIPKEFRKEKKAGRQKLKKLIKEQRKLKKSGAELKKSPSKDTESGIKKEGKKEKKRALKEKKRLESESPSKTLKKEGKCKERKSSEGRRETQDDGEATKGDGEEMSLGWPPTLDDDQLADCEDEDDDDTEWTTFLNTSQEFSIDAIEMQSEASTVKNITFAKPFSFGPSDNLDWPGEGVSGEGPAAAETALVSDSENDVGREVAATAGGLVRGPRIKHVCRKASVALGHTATFPERPELRLSALSRDEKKKVLEKEERKRPGTPDSDDLSIEEIIRRARDDENVVHIKDSRAEARKLKALVQSGSSKARSSGIRWHPRVQGSSATTPIPISTMTKLGNARKRKMRCRQCVGCKSDDCGECHSCKDMIKFGGRGVAKKACLKRECRNPLMPDLFFKKVRHKRQECVGDEICGDEVIDGCGGGRDMGTVLTLPRPTVGEKSQISPSRSSHKVPIILPTVSRQGKKDWETQRSSGDQRRSPVAAHRAALPEKRLHGSTTGGPHRLMTKLDHKNKVQFKEKEKVGRGDGIVLQSVMRPSQRWAAGRDKYMVMADLKEDFDIDEAWRRGVPVISSGPTCVRTVCFLCASAGKHQLVYCNVCCEPFHPFCLEDKERPRVENMENWCCRRCQFCHVCGKQNNLLCCDKCQNTYHPECLGPNYPTRPSRHKNIWVCTKCVKCKSCGVTSPGSHPAAAWTHDFSLCYDCGQLMDKGNYCPLCKKCYADDDWDCKMIQCSSCESWVHAKCEGLTDEMYQVLSYLPEDIAYNCRVCLPVHPAPWEQTIRREIHAGIAAVISALSACKSSHHLDKVKNQETEPELQRLTPARVALCPPPNREKDRDEHLSVLSSDTKDEREELVAHDSDILIAMEELDPDVLAAAESLLEQVCEAEDALQKENMSSQARSSGDDKKEDAEPKQTTKVCEAGLVSQVARSDAVSIITSKVSKKSREQDMSEDKLQSNQSDVPKSELSQSQSLQNQGTSVLNCEGVKTVMAGANEGPVAMQPLERGDCDSTATTATEGTLPMAALKDSVSIVSDQVASSFDSGDNCNSCVKNAKLMESDLQSDVARSVEQHGSLVTPAKISDLNLKVFSEGREVPRLTSHVDLKDKCKGTSLEETSVNKTQYKQRLSSENSDGRICLVETVCQGGRRHFEDVCEGSDHSGAVSMKLDGLAQDQGIVAECEQKEDGSYSNQQRESKNDNVVIKHSPEQNGELAEETDSEQNGELAVETNSEQNGELAVETNSEQNGELAVETNSEQNGELAVETNSEQNGELAVETNSEQNGELAVETNSEQNGEVAVETNSEQNGETTLETNSEQTGERTLETNSEQTGERTLETNSEQTGERTLETNSEQTGERTLETNSEQTGERTLETNSGQNVFHPVKSNAEKNVSNPIPSSPKVTCDKESHCSNHAEDEEVEKTLEGASTLREGGLMVEERSPSATLTADEAPTDGLSDFEEELVSSKSSRQRHLVARSFITIRQEAKRVNCPRDIKEVQQKVKEKKYRTVEEFNDDVVRILQYNMTQLSQGGVAQYRRKATTCVRSLFMKTMKTSFPWFTVTRSQLWDHNKRLPDGMLDDATVPPSEDHIYAQWLAKDECILSPQPSPFKKVTPSPNKRLRIPMAPLESEGGVVSHVGKVVDVGEDTRRCLLCGTVGDHHPDDAGRLVYAGQDDWVHTNCALWSAEVFEEVDGTLQNVHAALARGRQMKCDHCATAGATVGCCCRGCPANFHFMCARRQRCIFQEDKKVYCRSHWDMMDGELVENNKFAVLRRTCVEMTNIKWIKKSWQRGLNPATLNILIGSLTVERLGRLTPLSDCKSALYPLDFMCSRIYWSTVDARRRCVYTCRITVVVPEQSVTDEAIVKDMTVVHDPSHPNYDPAKLEALKEMLKPPPPPRRRRKSVISGSSDSSDSSDEDYMPPKGFREKGKPTSMRPHGIKQSSDSINSAGLPRATCGASQKKTGVDCKKLGEIRPKLMTPVPGLVGGGASPSLPPTVSPARSPAPVTKASPRPVLGLSVLNSEKRRAPKLSDSLLKGLGQTDQQEALEEEDDVSLDVSFAEKDNLKNKFGSRLWKSDTQQGIGDSVNAVGSSTIAPGNTETASSRSYFLQTVDTSECVSMRRGSQESHGDELALQQGNDEVRMLKDVITESRAKTLRDKLDVVMQHVGLSSQKEVCGLHDRLVELHSHMSVNETDTETSDRVSALLDEVPRLLSYPSSEDDSQDACQHLKGLSEEIKDLLEKASSTENSSTAEDDVLSCQNTEAGDEQDGPQYIIIQGASEVLDDDGNKQIVLSPDTAGVEEVLSPDTAGVEEVLSPDTAGVEEVLSPDTAGVEETTEKEQSRQFILLENESEQNELTEAGEILLCLRGDGTSSDRFDPDIGMHTDLSPSPMSTSDLEQNNEEHFKVEDEERNTMIQRGECDKETKARLTGDELLEAEAAMLKAQVDGKDDDDIEVTTSGKITEGLKQYPLRHTAARAAAPQTLATDDGLDMTPATVVLHKLPSSALRRLSQDGDINLRGERLPLADQIALKIKAESLARSAPSADGPFKCPTCKRVYRTLESYSKHVANCDYWVSSEDDDDDEDGASHNLNHDEEWSPEKDMEGSRIYPLRNNRLRSQTDVSSGVVRQSVCRRLGREIGNPDGEDAGADAGPVNHHPVEVRRGRGRPPRIKTQSPITIQSPDDHLRRSLRNSGQDALPELPDVTIRRRSRHTSGDSDRSRRSDLSPENDKALAPRNSKQSQDGIYSLEHQSQLNHKDEKSFEDQRRGLPVVRIEKRGRGRPRKYPRPQHAVCVNHQGAVNDIRNDTNLLAASNNVFENHKDNSVIELVKNGSSQKIDGPDTQIQPADDATTSALIPVLDTKEGFCKEQNVSPNHDAQGDVIPEDDGNDDNDDIDLTESPRKETSKVVDNNQPQNSNKTPMESSSVVIERRGVPEPLRSNRQTLPFQGEHLTVEQALPQKCAEVNVTACPGSTVSETVQDAQRTETLSLGTTSTEQSQENVMNSEPIALTATTSQAEPAVVTTPHSTYPSRVKVVSISPGSFLSGLTREEQKAALPKLLEVLHSKGAANTNTVANQLTALRRVRIISKNTVRQSVSMTSPSKPTLSVRPLTTMHPPKQIAALPPRPLSRPPGLALPGTVTSHIGPRQKLQGLNPRAVPNRAINTSNPALLNVTMETPNAMNIRGSVPNVMNLDNRQVVSVVSNSIMQAPQGPPLYMGSPRVYSQAALVQSSMVPSTAYLQSSQPMQVQMVNVLQGAQTVLQAPQTVLQAPQTVLQAPLVLPQALCVSVSQPMAQLASSTSVFNPPVITAPTLTTMARVQQPTATPIITHQHSLQAMASGGVGIVPKLAQNFSTILTNELSRTVPEHMVQNTAGQSLLKTSVNQSVASTSSGNQFMPVTTSRVQSLLATTPGNQSLPKTSPSIQSLLATTPADQAKVTAPAVQSLQASQLSSSDCRVLEELTGQKMSQLEGNGIDTAAAALLQNLAESSCKALPPVPVASPVTSTQQAPREELEGETPAVRIHTPQGVPTSIYHWTQQPSTPKSLTHQGHKVRFKKVIRKKILIRRPNMLDKKRKRKEAKGPANKRPCYYVTERNGMVHNMLNDIQGQGQALTKRLSQDGSTSLKEGQSLLGPKDQLKDISPHALKVSPSKIKVVQKVLRNSYCKENRGVDTMPNTVGSDMGRRKHPRKDMLREQVRLDDSRTVSHSHPLIHPHNQHPILPQPEVEEEVVAMPTLATFEHEEKKRKERLHGKRNSPYLVFEISSDDGFYIQSDSWHDAWRAVTEKVQDVRANARLKQLSYTGLSGLSMFGLDHDAVVYLIEQLYGAHNCTNYRFRYHDYNDMHEEPAVENPSGSARCEPFHTRNPRDMFSFLLSRYRPLPKQDVKTRDEDLALKSQRRATSMELPMAMRFRHLREHAKEAVGVYRSPIHGRGLFCKRDIDAGEMVIEYAGEVIRSMITDNRENFYESKGIGCYMFRIDDYEVVDATMHGNAARFINHCCDPNCYSRVINVDNKKHIIIFALRPIKKGEELTYDYKFPIEEVKIPCTCDAKRCRKYLN